MCPSLSRMIPEPEPSASSPPTDKVTTDGEAVAAASVVGVTSSVRLSCGDSWTLSLLVAPVEPPEYTATPPAPPPSTAAKTTPVISTGQRNPRDLDCDGSEG